MYDKLADGGTSFYTKYYLAGLFARWLRPNTRGMYWWDDVAGDTSTQALLTLGENVSGQADYSGDRDWYRVSLEAGQTYNIDVLSIEPGLILQPSAGAAAYLSQPDHQAADLNLEVRDSQGQLIAQDDDSASLLTPHIQFLPTASGEYFVAIGGFMPHTGAYALGVNLPGVDPATTFDDQAGAGSAGAASFSVGRRVTGAVDYASDVDWFRVSLIQWQTYSFQLKDLAPWQPLSSFDPMLNLYGSTGNLLVSNDDGGGWLDAEIKFQATSAGTYYLAASGQGSSKGAYALTAWTADDFAGDTSTSGSVAVGGQAHGSIWRSGDQDWFKVSLTAGQTYAINLEGSATGQGTLGNPYLYVYGSSGGLVTQIDDGGAGGNSCLVFTPSASGTYYLGAAGAASSQGTYRLSIARDDYQGNSSTNGTLAAGGSLTGEIQFCGDQDWFRVTLVGGKEYYFVASGIGGQPLAVGQVKLYGSSGAQVSSTADSQLNDSGASLHFAATDTAGQAATYYISVGGLHTDSLGAYRLSAALDQPGSAITSESMSVGGDATGIVNAVGDADWFRVSLTTGNSYSFSLAANTERSVSYYSRDLRLYDSAGRQVPYSSSYNSSYAPSATGVFYLAVVGLDDAGNGAFKVTSRVSASPSYPPDDLAASITTTGSLPSVGEVTSTLEDSADKDWFKVHLEAGTRYMFTSTKLGGGPDFDPDLSLYDSSGNLIVYHQWEQDASQGKLNYLAQAGGDYYVAVGTTGFYQGSYSLESALLTAVDDYPESTQTTGTFSLTSPVTGAFQWEGDADWFRIDNLAAGNTYLFSQARLDNPNANDSIYLLDSQGNFLGYGWGQLAFTPETPGSYFVSADNDYYFDTGEYRLGAALVNDDYLGSSRTSGTLSPGQAVTFTCNYSGDHDWFAVKLQAGVEYYIELDPLNGQGAGSVDVVGNTGVSYGNLGDNFGDSYEKYSTTFTPSFSGTYYLDATSYGGSGNYGLTLQPVQDDFSPSTLTTGSLPIGGAITGNLAWINDKDWLAVSLQAGADYVFTLDTTQGSPSSWTLSLNDGLGFNIKYSDYIDSESESLAYRPPTAGTYFVSVTGDGTGHYGLSAAMVSDDYAACTQTTGVLATPTGSSFTSVTGRTDWKGDDDWFRVSLAANTPYSFSVDSGFINGLYSSAGISVTTTFNQSTWAYAPWASGIYYVEVQNNATGAYELDLSLVNDDYAGALPGTGTVSTGSLVPEQTLSGAIQWDSDQDWFQVSLQAGQTYQFFMDSPDWSLDGASLSLYDSQGQLVPEAVEAQDGWTTSISYTPAEGGNYYLSAQSSYQDTGNYTISFDGYAGDTSTVGDLTVATGSSSTSVTGALQSTSDIDWFRMNLTAGNHYRFDLKGLSSGEGTLSDPLLSLRDSQGNELVSDDNSGGGLDSSVAFMPIASGTYYLEARASQDQKGTYRLASQITEYDIPNSVATTATLVIGSQVTSAVDVTGDEDWFRVELRAGYGYQFDLQGLASGHGTLSDPFLCLQDSQGNELASDNDSGGSTDARITFLPVSSGSYYLNARAAQNQVGIYTLRSQISADDCANTTETTGTLAIGEQFTSAIDFIGDQDWFKVQLVAGNNYQFGLQGLVSGQPPLGDPFLYLRDSEGNAIAIAGNGEEGTDARIAYSCSVTGTYFVDARAYQLHTGTYLLTSQFLIDDYAQNTDTTGTLTINGTTNGTIEIQEDRDWFKVSLDANTNYTVDLEGSSTDKGTLLDPQLTLFDVNGLQITSVDDEGTGLNSQLFIAQPASGYYYLAASGTFSSTGSYQLSAHVDDVAGNASTLQSLSLGSPVSGQIQWSDDQDWFKVSVETNATYTFDLAGASANQGTLSSPMLSLIDNNGLLPRELSSSVASLNGNAQLTYKASASGVFYLSAAGVRGSLGTYNLQGYLDDYAADTTTAGTLSVGGVITAGIQCANEQDWLRVTLSKDKIYIFDLEGADTSHGTLNESSLCLFNTAGVELAQADGGGIGNNSQLIYVPANDGTFYVSAKGISGSIGTYQLSMHLDDYSGDTGTAGSLLRNGSVSGSIDAVGDHDWFKMSLKAGTQYLLTLEGNDSSKGTLVDPYLEIYDSKGNLLSYDNDSGTGLDSQLNYTATNSGTYFVSAYDDGPYSGTYLLSSSVVNDYATFSGDAVGTVSVGSTVKGSFIGDDDQFQWYSVSLAANKRYVFEMSNDDLSQNGQAAQTFDVGIESYSNPIGDPYIYLYSSTDPLLGKMYSDDDSGGGTNAKLTFSVATPGTYYLVTSYLGANGLTSGDFDLSVSEAVDDSPDECSYARQITVGKMYSGCFENSDDRDWFSVSVAAGFSYHISLHYSSDCIPGSGDPYIFWTYPYPESLYYGSPGSVFYCYDCWRRSDNDYEVTVYSPVSGIFYFAADGGARRDYPDVNNWPNMTKSDYDPSYPGNYTIAVSGGDDYSCSTSTTGTLVVGGSVTGTGEYWGDIDWFAVSLTQNRHYTFSLNAQKDGYPDSSWLGIYDSHGLCVNGAYAWSDTLSFVAPTSGIYYIACESAAYTIKNDHYVLNAKADEPSWWEKLFIVPVAINSGINDIAGLTTDWAVNKLSEDYYEGKKWLGYVGISTPGFMKAGLSIYFDLDDLAKITPEGKNGTATIWIDLDINPASFDVSLSKLLGFNPGFIQYDFSGSDSVVNLPDPERSFSLNTAEEHGPLLGQYSIGSDDNGLQVGFSKKIEVSGGVSFCDYSKNLASFEIDVNLLKDILMQGLAISATSGLDQIDKEIDFAEKIYAIYKNSNAFTARTPDDGDDYAGNASTQGLLVIPIDPSERVYISGFISSENDYDWFKVDMLQGHEYHFVMEGKGSDSYGPTLPDPYLSLLDSSTHRVAYDDDGGGAAKNAEIDFTPSVTGTYFLVASASTKSQGIGSYDIFGWDPPLIGDSVCILSVPTDSAHIYATGAVVTPNARDWFQICLSPGCEYHFDLKGSGDVPLLDPYLYFYDSAGTLMLQDDNSGANGKDAHLDFKCGVGLDGEAGTYYVGVAAADGVSTGTYTLEAWDPPIAGYSDSGLSSTMDATLSQTQSTSTQLGEALLAAANNVSASTTPTAPLAPTTEAPSSGGGGTDAPASSTGSTTISTTAGSSDGSTSTTASTLMAAANTQVAAPTLTAPVSTSSTTTLVAPH